MTHRIQHADTHASGQSDEVKPASIGAAEQSSLDAVALDLGLLEQSTDAQFEIVVQTLAGKAEKQHLHVMDDIAGLGQALATKAPVEAGVPLGVSAIVAGPIPPGWVAVLDQLQQPITLPIGQTVFTVIQRTAV